MMTPKYLALLVAIYAPFAPQLLACQVVLNGEDVTDQMFVTDEEHGESFVDCAGKSRCRNAVITSCPIVKCSLNEACNSAQIVNVTNAVHCDGVHACHTTEILFAQDVPEDQRQTVACFGAGACDVAHIVGKIDQVSCTGVKACRKVKVEGSKVVKCHQGQDKFPACESFATLQTDCLYCGKRGCASKINQCRYKIEDSRMERYEKCEPETLVGHCPDGLLEELQLELSGEFDEDAEGGQ